MHRFTLAVILLFSLSLAAQTPTATIDGRVLDISKAVVQHAAIHVINIDTNVQYTAESNANGLFTLVNLPPGNYRVEVSKPGFRTIVKPNVILHVQDFIALNFEMSVGSILETVTVEAGAPLVNTESAAVGTVVDRNFAENLPMNGRSFQTLIQLTPGVVTAVSNLQDGGQFNVNGQRASANYWMVDGVGANIGMPSSGIPGNGLGGALGSFSVLGGTNSLVSIDALQEFRIQTSTYAPEFGRNPGAQISIVTRSGTNQFHGTAFDYLRNDALDANDWFADQAGLPKPKERQNDFGGTFSGPILRNKTFFFFSYEGLRLRLPEALLTTVPDISARQTAKPALQPFLNAFPLPNGTDSPADGTAEFNASISNPATLDAYSLRIDHRVGEKVLLFGRYNYSPSELVQRGGGGGQSLNQLLDSRITTQTATAGITLSLSPLTVDDLRVNYSQTDSSSQWRIDGFGGAVPLPVLPLPVPFTSQNALFSFTILSLRNNQYLIGNETQNGQRQINLVDNLSLQRGAHSLKFGVDYRRLTPPIKPALYAQLPLFSSVSAAQTGDVDILGIIGSQRSARFLFQNLGAFAQDTWRITPRLTLTYGLRWDVDFAPSSLNGPALASVTGFDLTDLSNMALATPGNPPFRTKYGNLAPRIGAAYGLGQKSMWNTVLRGGFGLFYDLSDGEAGNILGLTAYPYGAIKLLFGSTFPFDAASAAPPPITASSLATPGSGPLAAFDPNLRLPYTLEWNVALQQALGEKQALSISYVGSAGRRLIQTARITSPNPNINSAYLVFNLATSDYSALQTQFQRRLSRGLQALASYTWSHSIDTASAGSTFVGSNSFVPSAVASTNRGPSDFDIRNTFSLGATYDIPVPRINPIAGTVLHGWSLENVFQARSATPVNVFEADLGQLGPFSTQVRPDVVAGQSLYLFGSQYPGGKALNPAAFTAPPLDQNGNPLRQGDLVRNALRGFGMFQWDFAIHREFPIIERLKLQFRAEMFNVLNHPNFGPPQAGIGNGGFGLATSTLGQHLGNNVGSGGFDPLYQVGGPRSIQFALKIQF